MLASCCLKGQADTQGWTTSTATTSTSSLSTALLRAGASRARLGPRGSTIAAPPMAAESAAIQELAWVPDESADSFPAGSPDNLFLVFVEPWTLTASLYPGARWAGGVVASTPGAVAM